MKRYLLASMSALGLTMVLAQGQALAAPACGPAEEGQLRCTINEAADCDGIPDLPYARDLFCPAAFDAAQVAVAGIADTLGVPKPTSGFFYFFLTPPDPLSPPDQVEQTTIPCLDTPAPYSGGSTSVHGGGVPLCHLVAYVTSPGPDPKKLKKDDPNIPKTLRGFPDYFSMLYSPGKKADLKKFRTGSAFDRVVATLGADGSDQFQKDYGKFKADTLYDPDHFKNDGRYRGISGGGGGGWGGEVAIVDAINGPIVQFAFGGGGGGGMNSSQPNAKPAFSKLGSGGGGGAQFASGYTFGGKSYNGLGLGAGFGSSDTDVQYSYNDVVGAISPAPVHQYNPVVIAEYTTQLDNLAKLLKDSYNAGKAVVVRGGGGMGAGTEYLTATGDGFLPHALSTQGAFQFNYQFTRGAANSTGAQALNALNLVQEDLYAIMGEAYRAADQLAFEDCGKDYSNFACMCPREHAHVICIVNERVQDPSLIPGWLQQRHCPGDDVAALSGENAAGFTSYQQFLIDQSRTAPTLPATCTTALQGFFRAQN